MTAARWDVYHLYCHQVQPEPKNKLVVVAHLDAHWFYGLLINSKINNFYQKRPKLLPCMVEVFQEQHDVFLNHDSYVDCTGVYTFSSSELTDDNRRGKLHDDAIEAVIQGIKNCRLIKQVHKNLLLS